MAKPQWSHKPNIFVTVFHLNYNQIQKYYHFFSWLHAIPSIVFVFSFSDGNIAFNLGLIFFYNLIYHFAYHIIRPGPFIVLFWHKDTSFFHFIQKAARFYSYGMMSLAILIEVYILKSAIFDYDWFNLFGVFIPVALFLGALQLRLYLVQNKAKTRFDKS